jgi:hypothetical protein
LDIVNFFVDQPDVNRGAESQGAKGKAFSLVQNTGAYSTLSVHCRDAANRTASGGYVAVSIRLDGGSTVLKLLKFFMLPFRLTRVKRILGASGVTANGLFCITPTLDDPTFIFPLTGSARTYAQCKLLPKAHHGALCILRKGLSWWAGCDVSIGAILMIGSKQ